MPRAWDINPGGRSSVVVAVLDTGLTTTANTLQFRIWTGRAFQFFAVPFAKAEDFDHSRVRVGREFAFDWQWITQSGEPLVFDATGHGTHVAGTIAQQNNISIGFAALSLRSPSSWPFPLMRPRSHLRVCADTGQSAVQPSPLRIRSKPSPVRRIIATWAVAPS